MRLAMWQLLKLATISLRCIPALFRSRSKQAIVEKPWSAGIAKDFGCTGDLFRSVVLGDLPFLLRYRPSFVDSQMKTAGAPERFGLNSKNLGSRSASPQSLDISQSESLTMVSANAGGRSFTITGTASPRWTSWSSPPLGFNYCTSGL